MKILFLPPTNKWSVDTGYIKRWEEFMESIPADGSEFQLANNLSDADFVISQCVEEMSANFAETIRPLSRKDIMTFVWDISDRPTSRFSGFYCSLPKFLFDHRRHSASAYPIPFNKMIDRFPIGDAEMDFSFLGAISHTVRIRLVETLKKYKHNGKPMAQSTGNSSWEFTDDAYSSRQNAQLEFSDLMRRSKFVLCPRGYGTGSMRMFEVMQSGRVPVIISDNYVLPSDVNWKEFSLIIPENRIGDIPEIVQANMANWESMAKNARVAWEKNFSPEATLSFFGKRMAKLSQSIASSTFRPWHHSAQMATTVFFENARPLAGKAKQKVRKLIRLP